MNKKKEQYLILPCFYFPYSVQSDILLDTDSLIVKIDKRIWVHRGDKTDVNEIFFCMATLWLSC